jgi:hypothetical protein
MKEPRRFHDSVTLDNGKTVRISALPEEAEIKIMGRTIKVSDIPLVAASLKCGCYIRGIALKQRDVIFCETHQKDSFVAEIIS